MYKRLFSYTAVNPLATRPNPRHVRGKSADGGENILEARHYITQYNEVSDRNSSHARRKLHPPKFFYPPDQRSLSHQTRPTPRHYYYQSPGHYGDGNISAIRLSLGLTFSHSLSLSLSFLYIYLRPETHRIVVFVVIIIVIPKLYATSIYIYIYNNTKTTTREESKNKLKLFDFLSFEPFSCLISV